MRNWLCLLGFLFLLSCNKQLADKTINSEENQITQAYKVEIEKARAIRLSKLKAPKSWLAVIGLHWLEQGVNTLGATLDNTIVFPRTTTETIGAYQVSGDEVFFGKVEGIEVMHKDQEYLGGPVDTGYPPTIVNHGSLYWYVMKRGEKYGIRLLDTLSDHRLNFPGLSYFDIEEKYKVEATVRKPDSLEVVSITNVIGNVTDYPIAAYLDFTLNGETYALMALDEGNDTFFVIYGDQTNAETSYGGGRFIYPKKAAFGAQTILDFNLSQNPPCAFTDFATCPLPPSSNKLPIKISSGEKAFHFSN